METISPFRIQISDSELDDLRRRLEATRLPDVAPNEDFARGTSAEYLAGLLRHWQAQDWRGREELLNELPQYRTRIDGTDLHFVHQRPTAPHRGAVLLMHGWPDSFLRYRRVIGPLAEAGFEVVAPSLPGYGFSGHRAQPSDRTADLYAKLMADLGLPRFLAAGADLSTAVALQLGRRHPQRLRGLHLLDIGYPSGERDGLGPAEQEWLVRLDSWFATEGGYAHVQGTRPQIVGPALVDSPAGLAAWLVGFIDTASADHDVETTFGGRDALLDNLSLYWFTGTGASAADAYAADGWELDQSWVDVPTAMLIAPRDSRPPRAWCERVARVVRYSEPTSGGHFLPMEEPQLYTEDLIAFSDELATDC